MRGRAGAHRESAEVWRAIETGEPFPDRVQATTDLGLILGAIRGYAASHDDELPPDLGAVLAFVPQTKRTATAAQKARVFLSPRAKRSTFVPETPTGEWVTRHTSYVYLGGAGVTLARVVDPEFTVLVHARFADTVRITNDPHLPIGTALGLASVEPEEYGRWIVEQSKRVIDAVRAGSMLPDCHHAIHDLAVLGAAIEAYAAAHHGLLPPDLAATVEYVPRHLLLEGGPMALAHVYLSPRDERVRHAPERVTTEWVRDVGSYTYLGGPGVPLQTLRERGSVLIVHSPLDEPYDVVLPRSRASVVVVAGTTHPYRASVKRAERQIAESRMHIEAARAEEMKAR